MSQRWLLSQESALTVKKRGHRRFNCKRKNKRKTQNEESCAIAFMAIGAAVSEIVWILDSGSTIHVTNQLELLDNVKNWINLY